MNETKINLENMISLNNVKGEIYESQIIEKILTVTKDEKDEKTRYLKLNSASESRYDNIQVGKNDDLYVLKGDKPRFTKDLKTMREKENNLKFTPVSALTANAIKGEKEKFLELGMNYYLTKPIKLNDLKELFNIYLVNKEKSSIQSITKKQEFINTKEKEPEISSNSLFA